MAAGDEGAGDLRIVRLGPDDRAELLRLDQSAFGFPENEVDAAQDTAQFEWDRTFGAIRPTVGAARPSPGGSWRAGEDLAGLLTSYSLSLTVPGPADATGLATQETPVAGVSWVSVHPDHRRRGVLTALMRHHLTGQHEQPAEAVSALFASEPAIYQRFGYGEAAAGIVLTLARGAELRDLPAAAEVRTQFAAVDVDEHLPLVDDVFAQAQAGRPGRMSRPSVATRQMLEPRPERHRGVEELRIVVARTGGRPTGYALLRRNMKWAEGSPAGEVEVIELCGVDSASEHALWTRLLDLDLTREIVTPLVGLDDPLLIWLVDPRAARPRRQDALWLRLVDVDRALCARGYATDIDLVLAVHDETCPWNAGSWRLHSSAGQAGCERVDRPGDVELDVRDLAAAYLGGPSLAARSAAGLVSEHRPGAVAALTQALRAPTEPAVPPMF